MRKRYIIGFALMGCIGLVIGVLLSEHVYKEYYNGLYDKSDSSTYTIDSSSRNLAMMLETGAGTGEYSLSTSSTWPDESEYTFNATASRCENSSTVSWNSDNKTVVVSGRVSDKCYIYFDKNEERYTLQAYQSGSEIWGTYRSVVNRIVIDDPVTIIDDYVEVYDISEDSDESILAYIVEEDLAYSIHIVSNGKILGNSDMSNWFSDFGNLSQIEGLDNIDTSNVTTMAAMFYGDNLLKSLDLSSFDTSQVTDMSNMFYNCSSLTTLDLSSFDTSQVTDMSNMFYSCSSLTTLDLSSFDTSQVTDMSNMFYDCGSLTTLDLSSFLTPNVTDMNQMFCYCANLTNLDLRNMVFYSSVVYSTMFQGVNDNIVIIVKDSTASKYLTQALSYGDCDGTVVIAS